MGQYTININPGNQDLLFDFINRIAYLQCLHGVCISIRHAVIQRGQGQTINDLGGLGKSGEKKTQLLLAWEKKLNSTTWKKKKLNSTTWKNKKTQLNNLEEKKNSTHQPERNKKIHHGHKCLLHTILVQVINYLEDAS